MSTPLDRLALYDSLPPEERAAVAAALADRPALAEAFARWRSLRAEVRADLSRDLPDRALLVLYALADDDLLSDAERSHLDASRADLDAALAKHPGLAAAVRRIRADRAAFERAWAEAAARPAVPSVPAASAPPPPAPSAPPGPTRTAAPPRALDRPPAPARRGGAGRWVWRTAALVAVAAFVALLTSVALRDAGWETVTASEAQTLAFADGSTVELAPGARIMVPEGGAGDGRAARLLGGQALFRVVRDASDPFEVTTPNAEVTVLGTTFSVRATDVRTEVVLASGVVALAPRAKPEAAVRLAPGERAEVLALDAPSAPERADLGAALAWVGEGVRYPLAGHVAEQIGWRYGVPVSIDPALAGEPVNGGLSGDDLRGAVDHLAQALGARVETRGDGFHIAAE
ncbi:FecR domain-containing protein [Rubrivirga sp. S365]|uniref:FecR family protein n=1 Tax=Rubrivirga sp. S365 TaxID=3076080 RepID=UPI0028C706A5|nr:FecR domain-containing protein [Rubrivirga sp. S365]MDT7855027.1 FecR domain-containing protein [Rubrivirga sp. S365]